MTEFEVSTQLFSQAAVLMMVGMGFVFAFLSVLILIIKVVISPLANRFPDSVQTDNRIHSTATTESSATVAAITAAITQYRQKHNHK
ncbi:OadG family protein [Marinicella litoralis]|uniref:Probable oxaloacetate decarboxylase gamma chain n=1 Tax=Marinicella litoralis TaxID=644220 RepID=A0A4R6XJE5_9GAMM|nr:OadG family transporter subunit [Marinicella litoralis]TDR18469.1 oxaloacetate decarboxylase gamma subunit [Marinicella litoralis]